jgi:hypothetical protein
MKKRNPYFIDEPADISFSGGRSSGYMTFKTLEAHNFKLPDYVKVCFANTGKEMPQTLDFVKRCADEWGIDITWLECETRVGEEDEKKKYYYETKVVTYETASRNGEPFSQLIKARRYMPNPVARFCTQELKVLRIRDWMNIQFPKDGRHQQWVSQVGIRYDEPSRVAKMADRDDVNLPMNTAKVAKKDIGEFWRGMDFDLELPNNNGVTDWGNCDLCFLKGLNKKMSIIKQRPDLANWWKEQEQEQELSGALGKGAFFRSDQPSYETMAKIAADQPGLFDEVYDDSISCFCGD